MTYEEMMALYPPDLFPWLYDANAPYPDFFNEPVPDLAPDVTPEPEFTPEPEPEPVVSDAPLSEQAPAASDPIEVISVGDLLDILQSAGQASAEELPAEELPADETTADPGDVLAVELDPATLALLDAVKGIKTELIQISDQVAEIQLASDGKPLLTTSFEDYSVSEGLLLLLLLSLFLSACYKILRGGLQWLRS